MIDYDCGEGPTDRRQKRQKVDYFVPFFVENHFTECHVQLFDNHYF